MEEAAKDACKYCRDTDNWAVAMFLHACNDYMHIAMNFSNVVPCTFDGIGRYLKMKTMCGPDLKGTVIIDEFSADEPKGVDHES